MRAFIDENKILTEFDVNIFQLVESGLCRYADLKDGSLNFRDVAKMFAYLKIKSSFINWQEMRRETESKARSLIR